MEVISIQIPASLYTSIYERYGEETNGTIRMFLSQLVDKADLSPQLRGDATYQYPRPKRGTITGRVWEIADEIRRVSGDADREAVIRACMDEDINVNTASTQFSYWRKANRA